MQKSYKMLHSWYLKQSNIAKFSQNSKIVLFLSLNIKLYMKIFDSIKSALHICILILALVQPDCLSAQTRKSIVDAVEKLNSNNTEAAKDILNKILEENPQNDAAYYYLGLVYASKGELDVAEDLLGMAAQLDTTNFWYRSRLADLYRLKKEPDMTVAIYEHLLESFPEKHEIYYELIDLYLSQQQDDKALETLDEIDAVFGPSEPTVITRFQLLARRGEEEKAYKMLEDFNKEYSSERVSVILGDYRMNSYEFDKALEYYKEALDINPMSAPALLCVAECYRMTGKSDEYFTAATELLGNPEFAAPGKADYMNAVISRGGSKFLKENREKMDATIELMMDVHPEDSSILSTAGLYYYSNANYDKSRELFRKNAELYPESFNCTGSYLEILAHLGDWEALGPEAFKAYGKFNETALLEMSLGAYYNLDNKEKCLEIAQILLDKASSDEDKVDAYSLIGDLHFDLGNDKNAFKAYEKALKINPEHCPTLNNYAYYLSLKNKSLSKAYKMSKITIEKEPDNATYLDTFGWILYLQGKYLEAKPFFKHGMLYGGNDNAVMLDHYAEVLFKLKEYDLAFMYWRKALAKNEIEGLKEKIEQKKKEAGR